MDAFEKKHLAGAALAGLGAGILNGLFGGGGGLVLIPGLDHLAGVEEDRLFSTSVLVMLPVSLLTLLLNGPVPDLPWEPALPSLMGSTAGGILAGLSGRRIPVRWLHRILGIMLLWGGVRYLC